MRVRQKNMGTPVADARVSVSYSGDPQGKIEETDTNESGSIEAVEIATPPLEYSMSPSESQPYSEVTVTVSANGYRNITVSGVEVIPTDFPYRILSWKYLMRREMMWTILLFRHIHFTVIILPRYLSRRLCRLLRPVRLYLIVL